MTSFIHYCDKPYLVMSEEDLGRNQKRLKVTRYMGDDAPSPDGNAQLGLEVVFVDRLEDPQEMTVRTFDPPPVTHTLPTEAYVPPEGEATMKVYCLQDRTGKRFWYVNASKTKQYREEQSMGDAEFVVYDVPKTKSGLIHFLNQVCAT